MIHAFWPIKQQKYTLDCGKNQGWSLELKSPFDSYCFYGYTSVDNYWLEGQKGFKGVEGILIGVG